MIHRDAQVDSSSVGFTGVRHILISYQTAAKLVTRRQAEAKNDVIVRALVSSDITCSKVRNGDNKRPEDVCHDTKAKH